MAAQPTSLLIADADAMVREGLVAFCMTRPELHVAGQCADGLAAVEMIQSSQPDFAIIELDLPKLHGLEVIRKVREANSRAKLVVLTNRRDQEIVEESLRIGANGYLLKDGPARHLLEAISAIQDGGVYFHPLFRPTYLPERPRSIDAGNPLASLSQIEYAVGFLRVEGVRRDEIAKRLNISPEAVDTCQSNIMCKLAIQPPDDPDHSPGVVASILPRRPQRPPMACGLSLPE